MGRWWGILWGVFAVGSAATMLVHEMWRDEAHAWLIAREAGSVWGVFGNLAYDGHPALWHLCLYVLSRFSDSPEPMQVLHWGIAVATAGVILARAPFTPVVRGLLVFGYFPFYEYCIKSRGYALGLLLLVLVLAMFPRRRERVLLIAFLLALLCHTSALGTVLAVALGLTLLVDDRYMVNDAERDEGPGNAVQGAAVGLWVLGIVTAVICMIPPEDHTIDWNSGLPQAELTARVVSRVAHAYLPHLEFSYYLTRVPFDHWLGVVLILGSLVLFQRSPRALLFYILGTGGLLYLQYRFYEGLFWHHGHLFLVWIGAVWMAETDPQRLVGLAWLTRLAERLWAARHGILIVLLSWHVVTAVRAHILDWREPYSAAPAAAQAFAQFDPESHLFVGDADFIAESVLAYQERGTELYYIQGDRYGSFVRWDRARLQRVPGGLPAAVRARTVGQEARKDVVFIASYPMPTPLPAWMQLVARFDESIWPDERLYIYSLNVGR